MSILPPLGGFNPKLAGAYLLPPVEGLKKKKTKKKSLSAENEEKLANFFEQIVEKEAQNMLSHLSGYDITAGWKK